MKAKWLGLFAFILALAGCAGGGGSSGGSGSAGTLFITDSLDNHDQVWVTIYRVELLGTGGPVVTFNETAGVVVDLKTLRDPSGERYAFLGRVPAGTYTGIRFTVDKDLTLFANGNPTGQPRTFAGAVGENAVLELTFAQPRTINTGDSLVIDFDLQNWTDGGATVTGSPFLKEGNGNGLGDLNRHQRTQLEGSITNLQGTAPNQTFTLVQGGRSVNVSTDANTAIFFHNSSTSAVLANGRRVKVRGAFSVSQNVFLAESVRIKQGAGGFDDLPEIEGLVSNVNSGNGTFTLSVQRSSHFQPTTASVNVLTNANTVFRGRRGTTFTSSEFFGFLVNGDRVEVEGTYDSNTNTLTARNVKLENEDDRGGESELRGRVSAIDLAGQTFDLLAQEWEGMNIGANQTVHIAVNGQTEFKIGNNNANAGQFFAALTMNATVKVEGTFDPSTSTLLAREARIQ